MMDEDRQKALRAHHNKLRTGIIVANVLPAFRPHLTDAEYSQVVSKVGNPAQVDELVTILLTKEDEHFDQFCVALEDTGYRHWWKRLLTAACVRKVEAAADSGARGKLSDRCWNFIVSMQP